MTGEFKTVMCLTSGCVNEGAEIRIADWDGSQVACGPCGTLLAEQANWHVPPEPEEPVPDPVDTAAQALAALTPEERAALINLLAPPSEGETP